MAIYTQEEIDRFVRSEKAVWLAKTIKRENKQKEIAQKALKALDAILQPQTRKVSPF